MGVVEAIHDDSYYGQLWLHLGRARYEDDMYPAWRDVLRRRHSGQPLACSPLSGYPGPRPTRPLACDSAGEHVCLLRQERVSPLTAADDESLRRCAVLDVAGLPLAAWEPYAAGGDWCAALEAWYATVVEVRDGHDRCVAVVPHLRWRSEWDVANFPGADDEAVFRRDILEASYRAGLAAGTGADNGWRDWLNERVEQWDSRRAKCYRLAMLDIRRYPEVPWSMEVFVDISRGEYMPAPSCELSWDETAVERKFRDYRDLHSRMETLPTHWKKAQRPVAAS